jgi:hypothetical protein
LLEFLHQTFRSTLNLGDRRTGWATWLAGLCIAMLLLSTIAQAIDSCELSAAGESVVLQSQAASPNGAICLICLMAHSVAATVLVVVFSPTFGKRLRVSVPQVRAKLFIESFQLYVRPPPLG